MSEARAEALLQSALEKIVYFEARSEQLQGDVATARAESELLKRELAAASSREVELRRQVAELEVALHRSHRDREELGRVSDALHSERAALLGKLLDTARIRSAGSGPSEDGLDLASFIAELRGEVLATRASGPERTGRARLSGAPPAPSEPARALAEPAAPTAASEERSVDAPVFDPGVRSINALGAVSAMAREAQRLRGEGRLEISTSQVISTRSSLAEETLFGFSVRELSSSDPSARVRAAERLKALGDGAAAPALATALHAERDTTTLICLLDAFRALARREGASVVQPFLDDAEPTVRIAALKAFRSLDPDGAAPHIARATQDPDPTVRRRAALLALALTPSAAVQMERRPARDADPNVRRVAALAVGAAGGEQARGALLEALDDPALSVRRAAAQSLERVLGTRLGPVAELDGAQRRREIRRLSTLRPLPLSARARIAVDRAAFSVRGVSRSRVVEAEAAPVVDPEQLCGELLGEIRSAIRGRSPADLASIAQAPLERVDEACALLIARGQVIRRGAKLFVA